MSFTNFHISAQSFENTQLKHLKLSYCKITNETLAEIGRIKGLKSLNLFECYPYPETDLDMSKLIKILMARL